MPKIYEGDCYEVLKTLPDESVNCCITSPPYYGLRDYGMDGQIGLEETPEDYINRLIDVFHEVKRVLKNDGTLWLNIGDSYATGGGRYARQQSKNPGVGANNEKAQNSVPFVGTPQGCKGKDLIGIPWMLAFALRNDGWYLRQDIIWSKPNPMPESVKDRCTKSHEYIFLLSKMPTYYFDYEAIQEEAKWKDDKRASQDRIEYDGKRSEGDDSHAQKSFVGFSKKTVPIRFGGNKYGDNDDPHFATKSGKEWIPQEQEGTIVRNKMDVWSIAVKPTKEAHFATYPEDLVEPCILAGSMRGGIILDPFFGSGTTGRVAERLGRDWIGIELNPKYIEIAERRTSDITPTLF